MDRFAEARRRMVKNDLQGRDITDPDVLRVMAEIPRELFVPEAYRTQAYSDGPLPIGMGQTISQPYIVALMTQELKVNRDCEVLEVGTGSGYQAAVLSELVKKVYTIERISSLSESAQSVLRAFNSSLVARRTGHGSRETGNVLNVEFCVGDGSCGWPGDKVFDRIIVTASVPSIPELLVKQLVEGGRIVAPVGLLGVQRLVVCEKKAGRITESVICDVRFVRLLGEYGFEEP
jgi:protein-L-isoaspartate(D-aspartate) O-methyltransferase